MIDKNTLREILREMMPGIPLPDQEAVLAEYDIFVLEGYERFGGLRLLTLCDLHLKTIKITASEIEE